MSVVRWCLVVLFLALLPVGTSWSMQAAPAAADAARAAPAPTPFARDFPPGLQIPPVARPGPSFDADKATEAYLALLSPEQRRLSDAYFEGGYWLELWGWLIGSAIALLLLCTGVSVRMRDAAESLTKRRWLSTVFYVAMWLLVASALTLPWSWYADYVREHQYGLSNLSLAGWLEEGAKSLGVALLVVPLLLTLLYAIVRRLGARWWIWASGVMFLVFLFVIVVSPVYVDPLYNTYKPLPDGPVRSAVLSLARANRIPTEHVAWFDASKQTNRVSANVSGFLGTTRVNLNDNLLKRTSLPEIRAVMGHEMGHYVLNHALRLTIYLTLVFALGLYVVHRALDGALARWGARLRLRGRDDPATLPLALLVLSTFFLLATPVTNSIVRQAEAEADAFGLNAAREPHGFAMASMRLSTYRKLRPGPLEEAIFFDHPSGYDRVHGAMLWLAENQDNPTANAPIAPLPVASPLVRGAPPDPSSAGPAPHAAAP